MELKTLKDIRERAIKDICKNIKVKPDTLCHFGQLGTMSVEVLVTTFLRDDLKQEAIKILKADTKDLCEFLEVEELSNEEIKIIDLVIKKCYNITEKDLKQKNDK